MGHPLCSSHDKLLLNDICNLKQRSGSIRSFTPAEHKLELYLQEYKHIEPKIIKTGRMYHPGQQSQILKKINK